MARTLLITGGLGYVGGRLALALAERTDWDLRVATRTPPQSHPSWLLRGEIVGVDLFSDADLQAACRGVHGVLHLSALNEIESAQNPQLALQVNGIGTLRLLNAACEAGVERFVYFSTAHVYGAPLVGNIDESTLTRPVHPYAISHHIGEAVVLAAHDSRRIAGLVLRLSNGVGAPAHAKVNRWTLIGNDLCRQAVMEGALRLRSSGLQRRDFITLTDVSRAVLHCLQLPISSWGNGLFNLGGEQALRAIDFAERVAHRCGAVLGYLPPIIRPQPSPGEADLPLTYRIDKLRATDFQLAGSVDDEIDATLRLCKGMPEVAAP